MILIVKNVPSSALSSKAPNRKQIGTKYLPQSGGKGACFFFMSDPTDLWVTVKLWQHIRRVFEYLYNSTQAWFSSVRPSFNCFLIQERLKTVNKPEKSVPASPWRFYLIFQFLWNKRFIMIWKTHNNKSISLLRREPAIPFLKLTRIAAHIWSSQH